jgi:hypothetical protein
MFDVAAMFTYEVFDVLILKDVEAPQLILQASVSSRLHLCCHNNGQQALVHCCSTDPRTPTTYSESTRTSYVRYVVRAQNERNGTLWLTVCTSLTVTGRSSQTLKEQP